MAQLKYHDIIAAAALRINAIKGVDATALEATYTTRPLTAANFQGVIFPFSAIKQAVLNTEEKIAHTIANTGGHPWRAYLSGTTAGLPNYSPIPAYSALTKQIIGILGTVRDADNNTVLTEKPLEVIRRYQRNANSSFISAIYYFKMQDNIIWHTRTSVAISCCVYDRTARDTAITDNTAILLADVLEEAYICGTVAYLMRDDEFTGQAALYLQYFNDTLQMIRQGFTTIPQLAIPGPTLIRLGSN